MSTTTDTAVTLEIRPWLAVDRGLASREVEGEIVGRTAKAVHFVGTAVVRESARCLRCGQTIDNPVSRLIGYGPICCAALGINWSGDPDEIAAVREAVKQTVTIDTWLPLSGVDVVAGTIPDPPVETTSASLSVETNRIVARAPFQAKDVLKSVRGARWNPDRAAVDGGRPGAWEWQVSPTTAAELAGKLRACKYVTDLVVDAEISALLDQVETAAASAPVKVVDEIDVPAIDLPSLGQPPWWIHQRRAFHFARDQVAAGLFIGMGGGKSRVTVDLVRDAGDQRVLILCPKNVVGVWPKQFRLYAGDDAYRVISPRKGTVAKRADEISTALDRFVDDARSGPLVVVVNYESAWREPMAKLLLSVAWDRVILDESHRIKAPGGKASRFCQQLGRVARRRLCLTGTPMPHSPLDVYAQYRFLDPGIFGTNFTKFRARYAVMGGYEGREVLSYQREDELAARAYSIAYRIADEELDAILGLETPTHDTVECDLSPKARKIYKELWGDLVTELEHGEVTADNALVRLLRLAQVTSGHLPVDVETDDGVERIVEEIDTSKADALVDLLEDLPAHEPVVVVCRFTHDLDNVARAAAKLGRRYGELSGRRRDALTDDSTLAEDVDVAGIQIQAGGVGIDLTRAHYCVFYSVGFSLGDYDQVLKRTHRPGQTTRVSYYHLNVADSIDQTVYEALQQRKDVVDYVLGLSK